VFEGLYGTFCTLSNLATMVCCKARRYAGYTDANNSQVYIHATVSNTSSRTVTFAVCVSDTNNQMRAGRLPVNPAKAQVMWLGSPQQLRQVTDNPVLSTKIKVVESRPLATLQLPYTASCHYLRTSLRSADPHISNVHNSIQLFIF